jgi:hypothetical protein
MLFTGWKVNIEKKKFPFCLTKAIYGQADQSQ